MSSSCMFMGMNMHELGMNKGFNPIFHGHESYSHAHEVMPLLHAHYPLLRDPNHERSLFMGMTLQKNSCSWHEFCMNMT